MSTSIRPIGSPFKITTERVMGSQCTTCNGRGWVTPPITSADGNVSAGDLVKLPCPNPACTVGKEKLGRDQFNKLSRMDKVLGTIKATVSVMPPLTNQYQFSETVTVTNVKAIDILDAVFEAAHQRIDEYQNMAIIMMDIDGNHYSFTSKDRPECGRLTTERKHKEQLTVTPQERKELEAIPFGDEPKLSDVFKRDDTINPDLPTSPMVSVNPVMMALEQIKDEREAAIAANPDKIEGLRKELIATLFDAFPGVSNAALKVHMTTALKASTFSDFILRYKTIEEAGSAGKELINGYIDVAAPPRATEPPQDAQDDVPQPSALAGNPFKPAERGKVYVKMGIAGISGSGKTYTALKVARDMFPKGRIAMLCTEHGAAKLYAPYFKFDLVDLTDYNPRQFIQYIKASVSYGYDALVIDSLTAEWEGDGGILSIADGKFGGWKTATPLHQEVISTIQDAQIHIFCTMLSKMGYDQSKDERGKAVVTKTGMEPKQRKDIEGEFHMFAEMDDSNGLIIVKSRCLDIKAKTPFPKGDGLATLLTKWIA